MPLPTLQQLDAFADGVAEGLSVRAAAIRAGYSPLSKRIYRRLKEPSFIARVEKFRARREQAAANDLAPIIERLVAIADQATKTSTDAAAMRAARELLSEAARLKRLGPAPAEPVTGGYELDRDAWLAAFAPKQDE